jgi:glycosyltransferase involved in cell wall biosynthesis
MTDALPTVSIVTPTFNHGQFLKAAIDSVLDQDYPRLEYFVADGGSTDQTLEILAGFEPKLRFCSEPDHGQADAINKAFARTSGQILGWLNSDDTLAPGAVLAVARFFAQHPDVGVVYGKAQFIDASGKTIGPCRHIERFDRRRLLHYSDFLVQPATFFRRQIFDQVGGLDPALNWALDYDLWLKAAAITRFEYLPRILANYRWLGTSKTAGGGAARLREVECVARRHGASGLPAYFRLEAVRMYLQEALDQLRRRHLGVAAAKTAAAASTVLSSPRAMRSLLSARTWQIIWMGQVLRHRADSSC